MTHRTSSAHQTLATANKWWLAGGTIDASDVVAAYQPKGAASLAASYVNLANPGTYNAEPGTDPLLVADGWLCNGTAYLSTGITPPENGQTWSMFVNCELTSSNNRIPIGSRNGSVLFGLNPVRARTNNTQFFNSGLLTEFERSYNGIIGFAGIVPWRYGVKGTGTIPYVAGTFLPLFLCAENTNGSPGANWIGTIRSIVIYSAPLTDEQSESIIYAMGEL